HLLTHHQHQPHLVFRPHYYLFSSTPPSPTELYTLSLHDALPIWFVQSYNGEPVIWQYGIDPAASSSLLITLPQRKVTLILLANRDRKSTRLNSSHLGISYAVFCLKKKKRLGKSMQVSHDHGRRK